ncbi:Rep family protein [Lactococcus taiwanensis]|uniref:Rep family protein n=1 Tax=Lactococcus taiwanensis TaxID=1151742 RepID=UPI001963A135|nr:Rep family protein [Lactococcus taiwanensis]QRZ10210.1 hypothetical protein JVB21_05155 [Lactococcus taiwanensis]
MCNLERIILDSKAQRVRSWFIQRSYYYETHDENGELSQSLTEHDWKEKIKNELMESLKPNDRCAFIFHDKDILEDGTPKGLHVHVLLLLDIAMTQSALTKRYHISRLENCQRVRAISSSARYLTHISNEALNSDKVIYPVNDVLTINCSYRDLIRTRGERKNKADEISELTSSLSTQIQKGQLYPTQCRKLLVNQLGERVGQQTWASKRRDFELDFKEYMSEKAQYYSRSGRNLKTIFISGKGQVGKSQIAKAIAYKLTDRVHFASAHGKNKTFDFVSSYNGESVTILPEASGSAYLFREFNNIFDPYQYSIINSRNNDKHWLADTVIFTTSDSRQKFVSSIVDSSDDNSKETLGDRIWQASRRLKYMIEAAAFDDYTEYRLSKLNEKTRLIESIDSVKCFDVKSTTEINKSAVKICQLFNLIE